MHSIFNCSSAAATSAPVIRANSLGENSSSEPAPLIAAVNSRIESGFWALKRSASITRDKVMRRITPVSPMLRLRFESHRRFDPLVCRSFPTRVLLSANESLAQYQNTAATHDLCLKALSQPRLPVSLQCSTPPADVFLSPANC